jgi:hypothetical protein
MSLSATTSAAKYDFYNRLVVPIPGWLLQGAAIRTMNVLEFQEQSGVSGSLLEIGIYCGKYFSVLMRHGRDQKTVVLGVDTFQMANPEKVIEHLKPVMAETGTSAKFLKASSIDCDPVSLLNHLGQRPRFISIDGSHEKEDVHWDLELAEYIAAPGSVIAVDDFINPVAFGVNEGVHTFFSRPRRFVPWAYGENKLFLSDRNWARRYREMLERTVLADDVELHSRRFREASKEARGLVEQRLWGSPLLLLP